MCYRGRDLMVKDLSTELALKMNKVHCYESHETFPDFLLVKFVEKSEKEDYMFHKACNERQFSNF